MAQSISYSPGQYMPQGFEGRVDWFASKFKLSSDVAAQLKSMGPVEGTKLMEELEREHGSSVQRATTQGTKITEDEYKYLMNMPALISAFNQHASKNPDLLRENLLSYGPLMAKIKAAGGGASAPVRQPLKPQIAPRVVRRLSRPVNGLGENPGIPWGMIAAGAAVAAYLLTRK